MKRAITATITALALVVGTAEAGHDVTVPEIPEHWRELPEMISSKSAAKTVSVVSRKAWGDPVGGVFFVAQTIETTKKGGIEKLRTALLATLGAGDLELGELDPTVDPSTVVFSIGSFSGTILFNIATQAKGKLRVRSVACFYNQREPDISEQLCKVLLTQFAAAD